MKKITKKKRKNILFSVLGIIILIVLFGLYYYFNIYNKQSEEIKEKELEVKTLKIVDINSKTRPYGVMINNLEHVLSKWTSRCLFNI